MVCGMYLTTHEVAARLGISAINLQRKRANGSGPPWKRFGRSIRYDDAALRAWEAQQPGSDSGAS